MDQSVPCSVWTLMAPATLMVTTPVTEAPERKCVWRDTETVTLTALSVHHIRAAVSAFDLESCTSYACLF